MNAASCAANAGSHNSREEIRMLKNIFAALTLCAAALTGPAFAQAKNNVPDIVPGARPVPIERIKVHGASLESNLEKDAADRDVLVFLPPGYAADKTRRYPVVYALHGYSIGAEQWSQEIDRKSTRLNSSHITNSYA